eukprot:2633073-Amphidinium_carterae.1
MACPESSHRPHHLEPVLWESSLEAVYVDQEIRDCAHRSDAALWDQYAHGPHHLEPALRERSLEPVCVDVELRDCAQSTDATLWKRSSET